MPGGWIATKMAGQESREVALAGSSNQTLETPDPFSPTGSSWGAPVAKIEWGGSIWQHFQGSGVINVAPDPPS